MFKVNLRIILCIITVGIIMSVFQGIRNNYAFDDFIFGSLIWLLYYFFFFIPHLIVSNITYYLLLKLNLIKVLYFLFGVLILVLFHEIYKSYSTEYGVILVSYKEIIDINQEALLKQFKKLHWLFYLPGNIIFNLIIGSKLREVD